MFNFKCSVFDLVYGKKHKESVTTLKLYHDKSLCIMTVVVEKSMKVCGSPESMDGDKVRVCSTLSGQRIF